MSTPPEISYITARLLFQANIDRAFITNEKFCSFMNDIVDNITAFNPNASEEEVRKYLIDFGVIATRFPSRQGYSASSPLA
jgi:hypothetical protein